jgi:hypothetical protein
MNPLAALGVRIPIPAEAVVPLLIACGVLLVLGFASSGLQSWKVKHSRSATIVGILLAVGLTGVAGYFLGKVLMETSQRHPIYDGIVLVGFIEGPIIGICGAVATIMWRFANQRWIALVTGLGIGALLIAKPLVWPLWAKGYDGSHHEWGLMDPEHLSFLGPGIVVVIVALVVGLRRRAGASSPRPARG